MESAGYASLTRPTRYALKLDAAGIRVLPPGRLLIRNICMVFDRYLREQATRRFSRVI